MRTQIAAANWKMNLSLQDAEHLMDELLRSDYTLNENRQAIFAVPFPYLITVRDKLKDKWMKVAAQNCSEKPSGAFTGEVSAEMLKSIHVGHVIIGHSERREYYKESNHQLADKIDRAL